VLQPKGWLTAESASDSKPRDLWLMVRPDPGKGHFGHIFVCACFGWSGGTPNGVDPLGMHRR
jgi:hypothetical protein